MARRSPRKHALGLWRFVIGGLVVAGVGAAASFQFDLVTRSLPKGKPEPAMAGRPPAQGSQGNDFDRAMAKVEENRTSPEDQKRLDKLVADVEEGRENFSRIPAADPRQKGADRDLDEDGEEADDGFAGGRQAPAHPPDGGRPGDTGESGGGDWLGKAKDLLARAHDGLMGLLSRGGSKGR